MCRELKGLGLNSCVALRKPLISEANQKKQAAERFDSGTLEEGHLVWWVQIYPVPEWWVYQRRKRGRWSDTPIMPSAYCISLWGQCCDLGLLQLVRSSFSNILWPGYFFNGYFLPWWPFLRWWCQDSSGSNCERVVQRAWDIIVTHSCSGLTLTSSIQDIGEKKVRGRLMI